MACFARTAIFMALFLVTTAMASNMDAVQRYRQLGRPVLHGLDHFPPLAARVLARDSTETDWETVTVTDTECSRICTTTTSPCETLPVLGSPVVTPTNPPPRVTIALPSPSVVITSTASTTSTESALSPTLTSEDNPPVTTAPVSMTGSVTRSPTTEETTATATATATETVSCSGSAECPSTTEETSVPTSEVPAPTQGVSTTMTVVPKPPVTSQFPSHPTASTIKVPPAWSTHHVSTTQTVVSTHSSSKATSEEAPTSTGSSTPAVPTHFSAASRLHSLPSYMIGLCQALLFFFEAL